MGNSNTQAKIKLEYDNKRKIMNERILEDEKRRNEKKREYEEHVQETAKIFQKTLENLNSPTYDDQNHNFTPEERLSYATQTLAKIQQEIKTLEQAFEKHLQVIENRENELYELNKQKCTHQNKTQRELLDLAEYFTIRGNQRRL